MYGYIPENEKLGKIYLYTYIFVCYSIFTIEK